MEPQTRPGFFKKHPLLKDLLSLCAFVICVIIGTVVLNAFVFRSYNVVGQSMENTLHNNDRVIVNRLSVTWSHFLGQEYVPKRGDIIVFANGPATGPLTCEAPSSQNDQYLIKRVIAFPGERVVVKDGKLTVYNDEFPDGFFPDSEYNVDDSGTCNDNIGGPKCHTSGEVDMTVPEGEIFVSGDNREGSHSYDSRSGLGTIPYCRIIGSVALRVYPFNKFQFF